jgi:hypothetical protein
MANTPRLTIPEWASSQQTPEVTHNASLKIFDCYVFCAIQDKDLTSPPGASNGQSWIVGSGATGAWAGQDGKIAQYYNSGWTFYTPLEGFVVYIKDENALYAHTGSAWAKLIGGVTAKGDIFAGTAVDTIGILSIGTNGYILTADSGETTGIKWAAEKKELVFSIFDSDVNVAVGDGKKGYAIPAEWNGMNLIAATASVYTPGGTGNTTDIQIRRYRAGTPADMLSTLITLSVDEYTASDGIVNEGNDDIATGDVIFIDVDAICDVAPIGLFVTLVFSL